VILVTGAGGFLGRAVCALLRRDRIQHTGVDRRPPERADEQWRFCDIADEDGVRYLFREFRAGVVVHLAGMLPTVCRADPALATRINIAGSVNLIRAAAEAAVPRFVFASSVSVYGAGGDGTPISEETPACPADIYGAAKRYAEIFGEAAARRQGFSFSSLRIATVVGPGARGTASPWRSEIFETLGVGAPRRIAIPFPERAVLSMVHVEDAARMLILLATRESLRRPVYNTPPENWTAGELKRVVEALDPNVTVELDAAGQRPAPPVADGASFVQDFAWRAPSLAERLAETVQRLAC
jgi:nucleoside-diphosphate-sugar epimerase